MPKQKKNAPAKKARKTKAKAKPAETPDVETEEGGEQEAAKEEGPPVRKEMSEVVQKYVEQQKVQWVRSVTSIDQWDDFKPDRLYTGIVDLDIGLIPVIGRRHCIVGDENTGKTVTSYILEGAARRTCRQCFRPIIQWVHPVTGEIKERCKCGKNDSMVVLRVETEDRFDPAWAQVWGVPIGEIEVDNQGEFVLKKSKDNKYWVATPTEGDAAYIFAAEAVESGAVDYVSIDSIAMLSPKAVIENENGDLLAEKLGSQAMMTNRGLRKILIAQVNARMKFGAKVTLVWTTQYYIGPTKNQYQDPRIAVGGTRTRFIEDCRMKIVSCHPEKRDTEGVNRGSRFANILFEVWKTKGDIPHRRGEFRIYLDTMKGKHSIMHPGDTDEADRLLAYLTDLGHFTKEKDGYHCLGKVFKKVSDIRTFFLDPGNNYRIRYLILKEKLSATAQIYLRRDQYDYCPWKDVPSILPEVQTDDPADKPAGQGSDVGDRGSKQGDGEGDAGKDAEKDWLEDALADETES